MIKFYDGIGEDAMRRYFPATLSILLWNYQCKYLGFHLGSIKDPNESLDIRIDIKSLNIKNSDWKNPRQFIGYFDDPLHWFSVL